MLVRAGVGLALLVAVATSAPKPSAAGEVISPPADTSQLSPTRFVILLERAVEIDRDVQVAVLANPNRVVVELPDIKMLLPRQTTETAFALVKSVRAGPSAPGRARVVIDVAAPVIVEQPTIEKDGKGYRLVLAITPGSSPSRASNSKVGGAWSAYQKFIKSASPEQRRDFEAFVKSRCESKQPLLAFDADEAAKWPDIDSIFRDLDERTCLQYTNP
jgi:hypothetical protein